MTKRLLFTITVGLLGAVAALSAAGNQATLTAQKLLILTPEQKEILNHMKIVFLPDGQGGLVKTIEFQETNVRIVDGTGTTDGPPTGLGNLIVGYNELRGMNDDDRTGSHNIVGGRENNYTSFGGLIMGRRNSILNDWSTVSGGLSNIAMSSNASISGGRSNVASGMNSSVTGGHYNTASDAYASVSGGRGNTASACNASVSGGHSNIASGHASMVSGGRWNEATGHSSSVSGGGGVMSTDGCIASGDYASVSGGRARTASNTHDWAAGSLQEDF